MRASLLLLFVVSAAAGPRLLDRWRNRTQPTPNALPTTFAFAPDAGMGLSAACACTGVTDVYGRPLWFDGGGAYCSKRNEWVGIQAGDMVWCPANTPRVMPGGDGTGSLGLSVWADRTNTLLRSQELDNAAWTKGSFTVAAPIVTANGCLAPDGTMTGEAVTWPAVVFGNTEYSFILQAACPIDYDVRTLYVRACLPDAGCWADPNITVDGGFIIADGIGAYGADNCGFTSSGFTRCRQFDTLPGQRGNVFYVTIDGRQAGHPKQFTCMWQTDCQSNTEQASSPWPPPIRTTSAAVAKGGDVAWFDGLLIPQWTSYSLSASLLTENGYANSNGAPATLVEATTPAGAGGSKILRSGAQALCSQGADSIATLAYSTNTLTAAEALYSCTYDGQYTVTACSNGGSCGDAGIDAGVAIATRVAVGSRWTGFGYVYFANGVVKNVGVYEPARRDFYLFGDSIVEGHTAGPGFEPQFLIHRLRSNTVAPTNEGVSGYKSDQCHTVCISRLNVVVDAGVQSRSFFMWQCGHNGSPDAGCVDCGAGVGVLGDATDCLKRAQDAGVHVIGSTVPPYVSDPTNIAFLNTALKAWGLSNGIVIANTYDALKDPGDPNALNPAYDIGDHVHPNDAGVWVETLTWIDAGQWFR